MVPHWLFLAYSKGNAMDHTTPTAGSLTSGATRPNLANTPSANAAGAKIESGAQTARQATDKIADKASAQVDRLSGTAHRAVDNADDAASSAAEWASNIPEQAKQVQAQLTEAASASIRARPMVTVAGALFLGYLLGRLARL
jgi:hypothetical protein